MLCNNVSSYYMTINFDISNQLFKHTPTQSLIEVSPSDTLPILQVSPIHALQEIYFLPPHNKFIHNLIDPGCLEICLVIITCDTGLLPLMP